MTLAAITGALIALAAAAAPAGATEVQKLDGERYTGPIGGQLTAGGFSLNMMVENPFPFGGPFMRAGGMSCTESALSGSVSDPGSKTRDAKLQVDSIGWGDSGEQTCPVDYFGGGAASPGTLTALNLPWRGTVEWKDDNTDASGPNGTVTFSNVQVKLEADDSFGNPHTCTYTAVTGTDVGDLKLEIYNPNNFYFADGVLQLLWTNNANTPTFLDPAEDDPNYCGQFAFLSGEHVTSGAQDAALQVREGMEHPEDDLGTGSGGGTAAGPTVNVMPLATSQSGTAGKARKCKRAKKGKKSATATKKRRGCKRKSKK